MLEFGAWVKVSRLRKNAGGNSEREWGGTHVEEWTKKAPTTTVSCGQIAGGSFSCFVGASFTRPGAPGSFQSTQDVAGLALSDLT